MLISTLAACSIQAGAELVGTTSSNFTKIPPYARAVGMGEAFTAVSDGTYGLYYNPAGMSSITGFEAQFTHINWFQGINYEHLDFVSPVPGSDSGKLGLSLAWFQIDQLTRTDALQSYDPGYLETFDFSQFSNKFSPFDYEITAGYALDFRENFSAGATVQLTSQNIDTSHGYNITTDIGLLYKTIYSGNYLRLGADVTNLGSALKMQDIAFDPPHIINVGLSDEMKMWTGTLLIAAQAVINPDYDPLYSIGFEYWLYDMFALRLGYMTGAFDQPTFGLGFRKSGFELDYAFVNYEDLGPTHRVSLVYGWGTPPARLKVSPAVFSPNNDKFLDNAYFFPIIKSPEKLRSIKLNVFDPTGAALAKLPVADKLAKSIIWDGKVNGKVLPDGVYQASITCEYDNGTSESNRVNVEIDNTPPTMTVDADPKLLKPGQKDSLIIPATFSFFAQDRNKVSAWQFIIWDYNRKIFFTAAGKNDPPLTYIWDGKGLNNQYVQTGEVYYYSLMTTDSVGNKAMTKPEPIVILLREIKLTFSSDALFDLGQANVKISAYSVLKTMKDVIDKNPESDILVAGYTDNIQPHGIKYKDNKELSKARADAVKFFMVNLLGYDENRIRTEGYGELSPIADNTTEEGRQKNRRVELTIKSTIYK
jgi:outer membrane protein OmpA-like peptidoglycan-associated protein